jgi:hypothetical protein
MSRGCEPIDDSGAQRQLGPDYGEIDGFSIDQRQQAVEIRWIDRAHARKPGDAGIAGGAQQLADVAIARKPGDQRVLARAAADDENPHGFRDLWRETRLHADASRAGLFR